MWFTADKVFVDGKYESSLSFSVDHGVIKEIQSVPPRGEDVTTFEGCAIFPGTVNTHTHAFHSLLRGQGDDLALMQWLHDVVYRHSAHITPEQAYWGAALAFGEMLKAGITTVVDFFYLNGRGNEYSFATIKAADDLGIRLTFARTFMDWELAPSTIKETVLQAKSRFRELANCYQDHPTVRVCPAAHSLYAASTAMIMAARECASEINTNWHMHVADSAGSERAVRAACGCSTAKRLKQLSLLDRHLVAVHSIYLDEGELAAFGENGVRVSHNPSANMFLGDGTADIGSLSAAGALVGLGTDSSLDNNSLSIFSEMKMAALAQKTRMRDPEAIGSSQIIEMGTINGGAIAEWRVGKLAPTYAADFIVIDRFDLSLTPDDRLASHMVYAFNSRAIRDVFVNGQAVVKNGRLARIEEPKLVSEARKVTRPFFCEAVA